jgi:hypothetical protein
MNNADTNQEMGDRVYSQAVDLWIAPEIERRALLGLLSKPFPLTAAQVIFPSPRTKIDIQVRLNEEVQVKVLYRADRPVEKGELVSIDNPDSIGEVRLLDGDEPDSGHLTMLLVGDRWVIHFDFRRDRQYARELLKRAREFYATATFCLSREWTGPAIENLLAAAELAAKAELLVSCYLNYKKPKDHGAVRGRYGQWVGLGNAPLAGNSALNKLSRMRPAARYCEGTLKPEGTMTLCRDVNEMISHAELVSSNSANKG